MAMHSDALAACKPSEASPTSTIDKLALAPRPIHFARHPTDTRAECLPGREMFREMLERQYMRDPLVLERAADGRAQMMAFLIERFVLTNRLTIFAILQLFSIMRVDPSPCLPPADTSDDEAYAIDLYALAPHHLKHAYRSLSGANDRRRAVVANPDVFKSVEALLMPPAVISPPPTPPPTPPSSDGEEEEEEEEEREADASAGMRRSKRPTVSASRRPDAGGDSKRFRTESQVVGRAQVAGLPRGWIREDRISPNAGKEHFVILSPDGTVYSSLRKAKAAAAFM